MVNHFKMGLPFGSELRPNWAPEQLVETERIKETDVTQLEAQDSTEEG